MIRAPLHNLRVSWKPVRKAVTQSLLPHLRACGLFRIVRLQMLGSLSLLSASCIILTAESYMSVSFTPLTPLTPSLHCTALHFISLHFTYSLSLSHSLALSFRARHQGACEGVEWHPTPWTVPSAAPATQITPMAVARWLVVGWWWLVGAW